MVETGSLERPGTGGNGKGREAGILFMLTKKQKRENTTLALIFLHRFCHVSRPTLSLSLSTAKKLQMSSSTRNAPISPSLCSTFFCGDRWAPPALTRSLPHRPVATALFPTGPSILPLPFPISNLMASFSQIPCEVSPLSLWIRFRSNSASQRRRGARLVIHEGK